QSFVWETPSLSAKATRAAMVEPAGGSGVIAYVTRAPVALGTMAGLTLALFTNNKIVFVWTSVSRFSMVTETVGVTVSTVAPWAGETSVTVALWTPASGTGTKIR